MMATDSQRSSTWSSWWLEKRTQHPDRACSTSTRPMASIPLGSRPASGSSRTSRSGPCRRAAASCTRCWLPWESSSTLAARGRRCRGARAIPRRRGGRRPVPCRGAGRGIRAARPRAWRGTGRAPRACTRSDAARPARPAARSSARVPASRSVSPKTARMVVVLPAPFGPRKPTTCPLGTEKVRSSSARQRPEATVQALELEQAAARRARARRGAVHKSRVSSATSRVSLPTLVNEYATLPSSSVKASCSSVPKKTRPVPFSVA